MTPPGMAAAVAKLLASSLARPMPSATLSTCSPASDAFTVSKPRPMICGNGIASRPVTKPARVIRRLIRILPSSGTSAPHSRVKPAPTMPSTTPTTARYGSSMVAKPL